MKLAWRLLALPALVLLAAGGADRSIPTATPTAPPVEGVIASGLTVSISGPTAIRPDEECMWRALPSGGTAPYTYSWGQTPASGYPWGSRYHGSDANSFTLSVTVTDAVGLTGYTSTFVNVSSNAPICP